MSKQAVARGEVLVPCLATISQNVAAVVGPPSKTVKRVTGPLRALSNSDRDSEKGKATERWRRKVTGLTGDEPHGSGTAGIQLVRASCRGPLRR